MEPAETRRAVAAARTTATDLGLDVDDVVVVNNSDRIAARLTGCESLVRIAPDHPDRVAGTAYEIEVARKLGGVDAPVGVVDPRVSPEVYLRDGFSLTFWTYYPPNDTERPAGIDGRSEQLGMSSNLEPDVYADALVRLHAGLRRIELEAPPISARISDWTRKATHPAETPELSDRDRALLVDTFRRTTAAIRARHSPQQILHGEPHPGNLLDTAHGPLFVDLGTCQRGPIEYDLSYVPDAVAERYPGADLELVEEFRILMWAGVATMRWSPSDQFPDRDRWRIETLSNLRAALARA